MNNWRKSSYSGDGGSNCVEVGNDSAVLVRDSKQDGTGPMLRFTPDVWRRLVKQIQQSLARQQKRACADLWSGQALLARYRFYMCYRPSLAPKTAITT
jgi:uncharacterized protein DUF397